jgi:DNA polymerase-4
MKRVVLHVDMDAFYAAVEQRDRPELRGKPVVIGSAPNERGVVAAVSYEARRFGIHSAMPSREAGRLCPHAVFLPPDMARYEAASRQIFALLDRFTPLVEPLSIDEAFLDVTGTLKLFGPGPEMARKIKDAIRAETGLTASVGVACNKFLAKVASDLGKPDGLLVVPESREGIIAFLAPLPVSRVWGVGKVTEASLQDAGIRTIGDLQHTTEERLAQLVGRHSAGHLLHLAWGEDVREVETGREEKSISREYTFPADSRDEDEIRQTLYDLVESVGEDLRNSGKHAQVVRIKLRWQGFKTLTRQEKLNRPVCDNQSLREVAERLFSAIELASPVRLIGFGVSNFGGAQPEQMSLFNESPSETDRQERLSKALDVIREKHSPSSLFRASKKAWQDGSGR